MPRPAGTPRARPDLVNHPQCQVDPAALGQKAGTAPAHPVYAVIRQSRRALHHDDITRFQPDRSRWPTALRATHAKQSVVPKRYRHHGHGKIRLVPVLMQAHPGAFRIKIHKTTLRISRHAADLVPDFHHAVGNRRPWHAAGMQAFVPVAAPVRHPSVLPCSRHAHRHFAAPRRLWHK